jgi:acetyltransferase
MAVVGVSGNHIFNPGYIIFQRNLMIKGHDSGKVFGINPKGGLLEGTDLLKSLYDVPKRLDLAVLCVRPADTVQAFKECIDIGVKSVIIISGGFAEVGGDGLFYQNEIRRMAFENNVPVIGPNCVGVFSPGYVNTIIVPNERVVLPDINGNVAIVSQSGGVMIDQWFAKYKERSIGISRAVSVGNKAVLDEVDILEFFETDDKTDVIGFYLEGFAEGRGREFLLKSRHANKTIIMLKGGKSEGGFKAAASHTAAVASNARVLDGAFKQFSIINCQTEQEVVAYSKAMSLLTGKYKPFPTREFSGEVAVITVSGGHGVIAVDTLARYGLKLQEFSDAEKDAILSQLSPAVQPISSVNNPIDLTGSCSDDDLVGALEALMINPRVELVLLLILPYPPGLTMSLGSRVASIARVFKKPLIAYLPYVEKYAMIREALDEAYIPVGNSIEEAILMVHAVYLKSRALVRASFNKDVGRDEVLIEDYQQFQKVLNEINASRTKKKANVIPPDDAEYEGESPE